MMKSAAGNSTFNNGGPDIRSNSYYGVVRENTVDHMRLKVDFPRRVRDRECVSTSRHHRPNGWYKLPTNNAPC